MQGPEPGAAGSADYNVYKRLFEIGRGGMGVVSLALARGPEGFTKLCVLKQLHEHLVTDPGAVQMLLEEARVSVRLSHRNVVQVYEATLLGGVPTIVMEYLEGQPLPALFGAPKTLPLHLHLAILTEALGGLDAAHEQVDYDGTPLCLVHRDMSPHNIFVGYDAEVKVLDFGIAKIVGSEAGTKTGVLKGKLRYMSPEQVGGGELDRRSDIFSVGVMLWEALACRRMWGDASDGQVLRALLTGDIPKLGPNPVDPRLARVCERALAIEPEDRYATAAEFGRELQLCMGEQAPDVHDGLIEFLTEQFGKQREEMRAKVAERIRHVTVSPPARLTMSDTTANSASLEVRRRPSRPWLLATASAIGATLVAAGLIVSNLAGVGGTGPVAQPRLGTVAALDCPPGTRACDGQCVSIERPEYGCGSDSCAPCALPNATPRCSRDHKCDVAVCYRGYDNCDGIVENGCEVSLRTDPKHCGACSEACPELLNAEVGCGDSCRIWRCAPGFEDCNGASNDGCETFINTDTRNCGGCESACPTGARCKAGRCTR